MIFLEQIFASPVMPAIGLALIHLIWQGAVIGGLLGMALRALRDHAPQTRYTVSLIAMVSMLAAPFVTTFVVMQGMPATAGRMWGGLPVVVGQGPAPAWILPILPWLASAWIAGALILHVRLVFSCLRVERLKRVGVRAVPRAWQAYVDQLSAHLGIRRHVRIIESSLVLVPAVVGWLSPVILIPAGVLLGMSAQELRGIIAHELAHVRRHDYLVNLVQSVFEALLFFHPVTWWISRRLRIEREFCCDDIAITVCDSALQYARALSSLEELRDCEFQAVLAYTGGSLLKRVTRIFTPGQTHVTNIGRWLVPTVVLAALVTFVAVIGIGCTSEEAVETPAAPTMSPVSSPDAADANILVEIAEELQGLGSLGEAERNFILARVSRATGEGSPDGPRVIDIELIGDLPGAAGRQKLQPLFENPEIWSLTEIGEIEKMELAALRQRIIELCPDIDEVEVEKTVGAGGQTKVMILCVENGKDVDHP